MTRQTDPRFAPAQADYDDFDEFLDERLTDPAFRAAFEDAEMRSALIANLAKCRRAQDIRQAEVAKHMGVGQSFVSEFENEVSGDSYLSTLQRYARAVGARLKCSIDMPANQDWASHVSSRAYSVRPDVTPGAAVRAAGGWSSAWAKDARASRDDVVLVA